MPRYRHHPPGDQHRTLGGTMPVFTPGWWLVTMCQCGGVYWPLYLCPPLIGLQHTIKQSAQSISWLCFKHHCLYTGDLGFETDFLWIPIPHPIRLITILLSIYIDTHKKIIWNFFLHMNLCSCYKVMAILVMQVIDTWKWKENVNIFSRYFICVRY